MSILLDQTTKSYNQKADVYSKIRPLIMPVIKQLDMFIELLVVGKKVLDVGCGPGRDAEYLKSKGVDVIGVDISKELLKIASKNVNGVQFKKMDMRHLDFVRSQFDGLWVNTSFLHLPKSDSLSTLRGFCDVLKPQGVLFLGIQSHQNETGNIIEKHNDSEMLISTPDFGDNNPRLFSYYSVDQISDLLVRSGFVVIDIKTNEESDTKIVWLNIFARKL